MRTLSSRRGPSATTMSDDDERTTAALDATREHDQTGRTVHGGP